MIIITVIRSDCFCLYTSSEHVVLNWHSQLWNRADPDTSFSHFEESSPQPEIKLHLEYRFNLRSVLLDFQSFTEKPVFECVFAHPIILFISYLVKNSMDRVSVICKLAMERYLMGMCASWLCPFKVRKIHATVIFNSIKK